MVSPICDFISCLSRLNDDNYLFKFTEINAGIAGCCTGLVLSCPGE